MEKKLRAKLEEEVKELRSSLDAAQKAAADDPNRMFAAASGGVPGAGAFGGGGGGAESLEELRRKFSQAEEKVRDNFFLR